MNNSIFCKAFKITLLKRAQLSELFQTFCAQPPRTIFKKEPTNFFQIYDNQVVGGSLARNHVTYARKLV